MSNKIAGSLERHFTPLYLIERMWEKVEMIEEPITEFLENSAGEGAMIDFIKSKTDTPILAYDIFNSTKRPDIIEADYLKTKIKYKKGRVVFMNPPWSKGTKFLKKSYDEADYFVCLLSANTLLNIDYEKFYLIEGEIHRRITFNDTTGKLDAFLCLLRKKKEGDTY
jgi:hypothetical protein